MIYSVGLAPTPAPASTSVPVNGEAKDRSKDTEDGDGVKRDFLDASMSDTIGLISNDFQVEVGLNSSSSLLSFPAQHFHNPITP